MKDVRKVFWLMVMVCMTISLVNAALVTSYTASDSPGSDPDGNGNTADVWTVTGFGGAGRSYKQDWQDGNQDVWAIWDRSTSVDGGPSETQATHTFAGGALTVGQSVSIDYAHNTYIDDDGSIGVRFLDGSTTEAAVVFWGGDDYFSKYDTGGSSGLTTKYYDRYDLFQVVFTLTGANTYSMTLSEGSITDVLYGNGGDDQNPDVGSVVASWTGTFTGSSITGIQVFTAGGDSSDQWFDNLTVVPEPATIILFGVGGLLLRRKK